MKHLVSKCLATTTILLGSSLSHAGLISDYSLNTNTNIITDSVNNLEWLQWSVTDSKTINQTLNLYSAKGWTLATNLQMSRLFDDFELSNGTFSWDADEETAQGYQWPRDGAAPVNNSISTFVGLFGGTYDPYLYTGALFGGDDNNNQMYNYAYAFDLGNFGWTYLGADDKDARLADSTKGIALVREITTTVDEPSTISLLGFSLLSLMLLRRKTKTQS